MGKVRTKVVGFPSGRGNGIKFHYNFRFERALKQWFAYRRIPCSCAGCRAKLREPIATRYSGPSNTCHLWEIFKWKDDSGTGLNDWRKARFECTDDCNLTHYEAMKADTMRESGKCWSGEIIEGNIGAYAVEDSKYDNYYLVEWTSKPEVAVETKEIMLDGGSFIVFEGDWYCTGEWLEKLHGARSWWARTGLRCIARLETLIMSDVRVLALSENNSLPARLNAAMKNKAMEDGVWLLSDIDHMFIIEAAQSMQYLESAAKH